ncbi:hypothetical protein C7212DRAFT_346854 [Tuber magnatum]|uniref:Uncharacterized protein n=1 Tax=Tuber magnatum TaxID=42249 RepID=A0A317SIK0_9PEZI|nr:hypothetical protein C7212DRAFT_346854 [Tuber magnatum]
MKASIIDDRGQVHQAYPPPLVSIAHNLTAQVLASMLGVPLEEDMQLRELFKLPFLLYLRKPSSPSSQLGSAGTGNASSWIGVVWIAGQGGSSGSSDRMSSSFRRLEMGGTCDKIQNWYILSLLVYPTTFPSPALGPSLLLVGHDSSSSYGIKSFST